MTDARDRVGPARDGDDDVGQRDRALDRRDAHPLERRLERTDRLALDDDHVRAEAAQGSREAPTARPETDDGERLRGDEAVRGAHEAVDDGRPDPVLVLEQELDRAVVDHDDGEVDLARELAEEPVPARGGLLGRRDDVRRARRRPSRR